MAFFVRSSIFLGRTTNHYRKCGLCFLINNYLFKSSSLYLLINNFNKFNLVIFRLIFKLKSFIVNINILIKFYQMIFALKKNIDFFLFNKINQGKISFSFLLFNTTNSMFYDIILYLFIFFLLIGIYRYVKSLKINVFSLHNFSLLDILHYLYSCRYILSVFIFIFYFINVINGLNIDIKEIYKIIDFLTKNGGFKNYILNINMNFDDNININFKHNNSSKTNKILAADNNNNPNSNNNVNNPNSNNNINKSNEVDKSKKAKFNNDNDKKEFQKLTNTIEKESKKLTRWIAEYNKKADMLEDLSSNYQGKVDRITKGINNINTNKNDKNDN